MFRHCAGIITLVHIRTRHTGVKPPPGGSDRLRCTRDFTRRTNESGNASTNRSRYRCRRTQAKTARDSAWSGELPVRRTPRASDTALERMARSSMGVARCVLSGWNRLTHSRPAHPSEARRATCSSPSWRQHRGGRRRIPAGPVPEPSSSRGFRHPESRLSFPGGVRDCRRTAVYGDGPASIL
jgi:hypothetical protein